MIEVTYDPCRFSLCVKGHAGYAERGKDIVCSAASILRDTLEGTLQDEKFCASITETEEPSFTCIAKPKISAVSDCRAVYDTIMNGYLILEHWYPDFVKVYIKRG